MRTTCRTHRTPYGPVLEYRRVTSPTTSGKAFSYGQDVRLRRPRPWPTSPTARRSPSAGSACAGSPSSSSQALLEQGATDLQTVSNNCGVDGAGLGLLLEARPDPPHDRLLRRREPEFARQYLGGELELELCPQGTLAERLRAGGAGIPAFYTPAGVGTLVAEGGLPWRYAAGRLGRGGLAGEGGPRASASRTTCSSRAS